MKTGLPFVPLANFLQKSPTYVVVLITMLLTYQLAILTWSLVPEEKPALLWKPVVTNNKQNSNQVSTKKLQQQYLFGEKTAKEKTVVKQEPLDGANSAPLTRLKLTLVGIVAATEPSLSSAIIEYKGAQDSYFIDSKIDGTSAIITHIYQDRIILDVKGSEQTLMLDGVDTLGEKQASSKDKKKKTKKSTKGKSSESKKVNTVNLDRDELLKNPGALTDYVRISPVREDGIVKGYRVKPGKIKTVFEAAGLKSGDLAVELNGIDLTDTQQAFTLMKEFPTMTDMTLSVERDGQIHELYLSIP